MSGRRVRVMKRWRVVAAVVAVLVAGVVWLACSVLGPVSTYAIAQGAFKNLARHQRVDVGDFEPPPPVRDDDPGLLTLRWASRTQPGCGIEVDVDRRRISSRPRVYCAPGREWKSGAGR